MADYTYKWHDWERQHGGIFRQVKDQPSSSFVYGIGIQGAVANTRVEPTAVFGNIHHPCDDIYGYFLYISAVLALF